MPGEWSTEEVEQALAELRRRYPLLSGGLFRILLKAAMQQVAPPDLEGLVEYADRVIKALKAGE